MPPRWIVIAGLILAGVASLVLIRLLGGDQGPKRRVSSAPRAPCEREASDLNPANKRVNPEPRHPPGTGFAVGFNDSAYLTGQLGLTETLRLDRFVGATVWRLPLDWGRVEAAPGALDFSRYDKIYCAAVAAGVHPLWHLTGVPTWATAVACEVPCVRPPDPEHLPDLRRFAELAAIRYPRAAAFEAWNEPNLASFWGGPPDPDRYVSLLDAIYRGVKDGNPRLPVLGGALSNNPSDAGGNLSLTTFLTRMVAAGGLDRMDAFSLHAYPIAPLGEQGDQFSPALTITRDAISAAGREIPIWITETGAPTAYGGFAPAVTPAQQASIIGTIFGRSRQARDVAALVFHTLVDPGPDVPGGPGFGFFTAPAADGSVAPKPAACALRALLGMRRTCPERLNP